MPIIAKLNLVCAINSNSKVVHCSCTHGLVPILFRVVKAFYTLRYSCIFIQSFISGWLWSVFHLLRNSYVAKAVIVLLCVIFVTNLYKIIEC